MCMYVCMYGVKQDRLREVSNGFLFYDLKTMPGF